MDTISSVELWEDDGVRDPSRLNAAIDRAGHVHVMRIEWQVGYWYRFDVDPRALLEIVRAITDILDVSPTTDVSDGSRSFPVRIVLVGERNERREIISASDRESPAFAACHARLRTLVDPKPRNIQPYHHGGPWFPGCFPFP
jgi:hypothetical protein